MAAIVEKIDTYLNEDAQALIMKYINDVESTHGWEEHKYAELSDLAAKPQFRGIHFAKIQAAAKALANKKKIWYDGTSKIRGKIEGE